MPTTAVRLVCRLLLAAAVLLGAFSGVLAGAVPATAHATLTGTSPAQNSVVGTAPELVSLTFSERVGMSDGAVRILDPNGDRVDTGSLVDQRDGDVVTYGVKLKPGVPEGTFTVAWKAVSADSHPISGAWTFSIGRPSETAAGVTGRQSASAAVQNLYTVGRYAAYSGFVLLVGGAGFVLLGNWRQAAGIRDVQRLTVAGWLLLAASTTLLLLLRHPYTTAGGLSDVFSLSGLRVVLETTSGSALVSRLLLLATAALFLAVLFGAYRRERGAKEQADLHFGLVIGWTVVSAGIAATWAMSEHASTGIQPQVAMPVDVLHLLAVAVWFGGLTMLLTTLHRGPAVPAEAVRRFSRLAFGSVLVLVATGVYQSWRQVGTWSALTSTDYGRLLMVKVGLMVVLTAVAFFSRRWTGRLADPAGATASADAAEPEPEVVGAGAPAATAASGASAGSATAATADASDPADASAGTTATAEARTDSSATDADGGRDGTADGRDVRPADGTGEAAAGAGAEAPGADGEPAPERAAQLARQRAAVAAARRRRDRDADPVRNGLRRSVLAEAAIAAVLLAVTTQLTGTEPARAEQSAAGAEHAEPIVTPAEPVSVRIPFDTGGENGRGTVQLDIDPARSGENTLHVRTDVDAEEIRVAFTLPDKDLGPLPVTPESVMGDKQHWIQASFQLPLAGEWEAAVTIRTSDVDQATETEKITIG